MVNYQDGKIYKISSGNSLPYIGSTITKLSRRLSKHKIDKRFYLAHNKTNKCASFDLLDLDDCKIELIELFPCNNKLELIMRERYWYDLIPNINIIKPFISKEEIAKKQKINYEKNKEHILKICKEYNLKNKDYFCEIRNRVINCECGTHYTHSNRVRHLKSKIHLNYLTSLENIPL